MYKPFTPNRKAAIENILKEGLLKYHEPREGFLFDLQELVRHGEVTEADASIITGNVLFTAYDGFTERSIFQSHEALEKAKHDKMFEVNKIIEDYK